MLLAKEKLAAYLRIYIMKSKDVIGQFSAEDVRDALNDLLQDVNSVINAPAELNKAGDKP